MDWEHEGSIADITIGRNKPRRPGESSFPPSSFPPAGQSTTGFGLPTFEQTPLGHASTDFGWMDGSAKAPPVKRQTAFGGFEQSFGSGAFGEFGSEGRTLPPIGESEGYWETVGRLSRREYPWQDAPSRAARPMTGMRSDSKPTTTPRRGLPPQIGYTTLGGAGTNSFDSRLLIGEVGFNWDPGSGFVPLPLSSEVEPPPLGWSFVPVVGSLRMARHHFGEEHYVRAAGWGFLVGTDVSLLRSLAQLGGKSLAMGAVGAEEMMSREVAAIGAQNAARGAEPMVLTHFTSKANALAIKESGQVASSRWGVFAFEGTPAAGGALVTGRAGEKVAVELSAEAAKSFARPPAFGPLGWLRRVRGVRYSPLG